MRSVRLGFALAILLLVPCGLPGGELPVETFFRTYEYSSVAISPSGNFLAALSPDEHRVGLVVVDLKNLKASWAFAMRDADVSWFRWANDERLLFRFTRDGYFLPGVFAVNRDGKKVVPLVHLGDPPSAFFGLIDGSTNEVFLTSFAFSDWDAETGFRFSNVERVNIYSGNMTREVTNPGHVIRWVADHHGRVRVGISAEQKAFNLLYREDNKSAWRSLARFGADDDEVSPIGFEFDDKTLLVGHYGGEPTLGLYTFDVAKQAVNALAFRHTEVDLDDVLFSRVKKRVVAATYETERPETFCFDADYKALLASLNKALPDTFNQIISLSDDEQKVIVLARSDRTPGCTYLLDRSTMKLEKLFELAEWIHPEEMAEMKPITYKARDGLTIHGYITIPNGSAGKNLPLVVNPHGGPIARDSWGFDPSVQFLANRGYAVLRLNFRGSWGYGKQFLEAGFKEWGTKQQDDITDGVKWAIAQGIADPKRICILGASYGGYAALMGLEQTPELYRCGISIAGVTDIIRTLKKSEDNILDVQKLLMAKSVGDRKTEKERLRSVSPVSHVDQILVPVLLAHGELDPVVPIADSREMARGLKKRGKLYDFIVKRDEAHGFHHEENRIELWKKIGEFLDANMR